MPLVSKTLLVLAIFQLLHSGFSSHEFLTIKKRLVTQSNLDVAHLQLPKDVQLEAMSGVILLILSVFMSFSKLCYLSLGGKLKVLRVNEYLKEINMNKATSDKNLAGCNPYGEMCYTPNLVDVHAKREQVAQWNKIRDPELFAKKD
ncbi:Emc5 [Lachancea thermotolerans]